MKLMQWFINGVHYNRTASAAIAGAWILAVSLSPEHFSIGHVSLMALLGLALGSVLAKANQHHDTRAMALEQLDKAKAHLIDCDQQVNEMRAQLRDVIGDFERLQKRYDNLPASQRKPRPVLWSVVDEREVLSLTPEIPVMRWDRVSRAQRKAFLEGQR